MRAHQIGRPLAADLPVPAGGFPTHLRLAGMSLAALLMAAVPCVTDAAAPRTEGAQLAVAWNRLAYDIAGYVLETRLRDTRPTLVGAATAPGLDPRPADPQASE